MTMRRPIDSPAVWCSRDVTDAEKWTWHLSQDERAAIVDGAGRARAAERSTSTLTRDDFDLPELHSGVSAWVESLREGRGFVAPRGLPRRRTVARGDGACLRGSRPRSSAPPWVRTQMQRFSAMCATRVSRARIRVCGCIGRGSARTSTPTARTSSACSASSGAKSGGESRIASSLASTTRSSAAAQIYSRCSTSPCTGTATTSSRRARPPSSRCPVLNDVAGSPRMFYIGWYIRDAQRHPEVPRLTNFQTVAMDLIESIANDPAFYLEMDFEPGDIQLLANAKILHSREAYEDHSIPSAAATCCDSGSPPTTSPASTTCCAADPQAGWCTRLTRLPAALWESSARSNSAMSASCSLSAERSLPTALREGFLAQDTAAETSQPETRSASSASPPGTATTSARHAAWSTRGCADGGRIRRRIGSARRRPRTASGRRARRR